MMATVEEQGDHSSGHCSGFTPDSLLCNEQKVRYASPKRLQIYTFILETKLFPIKTTSYKCLIIAELRKHILHNRPRQFQTSSILYRMESFQQYMTYTEKVLITLFYLLKLNPIRLVISVSTLRLK